MAVARHGALQGGVLTMLTLVIFWMAVYGLANAIAILKVGDPIRSITNRIPVISHLFHCPTCLSFWIGMAFSAWILSPSSQVCPSSWKTIVLDGLAASGFAYVAHVTMERVGLGLESI